MVSKGKGVVCVLLLYSCCSPVEVLDTIDEPLLMDLLITDESRPFVLGALQCALVADHLIAHLQMALIVRSVSRVNVARQEPIPNLPTTTIMILESRRRPPHLSYTLIRRIRLRERPGETREGIIAGALPLRA